MSSLYHTPDQWYYDDNDDDEDDNDDDDYSDGRKVVVSGVKLVPRLDQLY